LTISVRKKGIATCTARKRKWRKGIVRSSHSLGIRKGLPYPSQKKHKGKRERKILSKAFIA